MAMKMLFGYMFGKLAVAVIPSYQDKAERDDWRKIDPATLPNEVANAYEAYREANAMAADARRDFEKLFRDTVGFEQPKAVARVSKDTLSLDAFRQQMANSGRNA